MVSPFSFLLDASQDRKGWCVVLFRLFAQRWQAVVREAMVQVLVTLLNVRLALVFLPRLYNEVLQVAILEILAGRDYFVVVPVLQLVAELEFLCEPAKVPLRVALEVSLFQFFSHFVQLDGSQDPNSFFCSFRFLLLPCSSS